MATCTMTLKFNGKTDAKKLVPWLQKLLSDSFGLQKIVCQNGHGPKMVQVELESSAKPSRRCTSKTISFGGVVAQFAGDQRMERLAGDLMRLVSYEAKRVFGG